MCWTAVPFGDDMVKAHRRRDLADFDPLSQPLLLFHLPQHSAPCALSRVSFKRPTPSAQSGRSSQGQRRMYSLDNQTAHRLLIGAVHILICPRGAGAVRWQLCQVACM